jgi:hypothetical protein
MKCPASHIRHMKNKKQFEQKMAHLDAHRKMLRKPMSKNP